MSKAFPVLIAMALSLAGCASEAPSPVSEEAATSDRPLEIYWVDVDGGAATLIVTPGGESVLVDAGEDRESHAARIHQVASRVAGLTQIDHFVATHWHGDHYAGATRVHQRIPIRNFYDRGFPSESDYAAKGDLERAKAGIARYRETTQGSSRTLKPGDEIILRQSAGLPKVGLYCLASAGEFLPTSGNFTRNPSCDARTPKPPDETDNGQSLVLLLSYGGFSFLDTGDLTWELEAELVCPVNRVGRVDLFQISHHGLDSSNNPVLIESIRPRVVVVNNAPRKGAEPETMKTLMRVEGIETIWQVHRNLRTGPELNTQPRFIANPEGEAGQFIKASVRADGIFSVQIGGEGAPTRYASKPSKTTGG